MNLGGGDMFPLFDRSTPVIDRVRGAANGKFLGKSMGESLAKMMVNEDEESREEKAEEIGNWFRTQLAEELGLPEEAISPEAVGNVEQLFRESTEQDILTPEALQELGLETPDDDDEPDEDSPGFDSGE